MPKPKSTEKEASKKPRNANGEGTLYKAKSGKHEGKWIGQITIGFNPKTGRPIRRSFINASKTEVKCRMREAMDEMKQGIDLVKQSGLTFGEWILTWMEEYKKVELELSTWENYMRSVKNHIYPSLGHKQIKDLTTDDLQRFYNKLTRSGKAPATVRRNHQIVHSCLKQAQKNHILSWNPAESVTLPKLEDKEARAMTLDEMDKFISLLGTDRWGAALFCLIGTGLRQGEVLALKWDCVDLKKKTISVTRALSRTKEKGLVIKTPKTKKSKRIVPLPKEVAVALRLHRIKQLQIRLAAGEQFKDQELVFCTSNGTPIGPRNFTRKYCSLREKAGLSNEINLHALRHTYATRLLEQGESLKTVQELLGHADISTTGNTYAHVMPEVKRKAADSINQLLLKKKSSRN